MSDVCAAEGESHKKGSEGPFDSAERRELVVPQVRLVNADTKLRRHVGRGMVHAPAAKQPQKVAQLHGTQAKGRYIVVVRAKTIHNRQTYKQRRCYTQETLLDG
jgi:hypothetical protein